MLVYLVMLGMEPRALRLPGKHPISNPNRDKFQLVKNSDSETVTGLSNRPNSSSSTFSDYPPYSWFFASY